MVALPLSVLCRLGQPPVTVVVPSNLAVVVVAVVAASNAFIVCGVPE